MVIHRSLKLDKSAIPKMVELRQFVEALNSNPDISLRSGVFKGLDKTQVFTRKLDGWEVGFKVEDHGLFCTRKVFIKCEQPLSEVPDKDKDSMFAAALDAFLDRGQSVPDIEQIAINAVMVTQNFMPLIQMELNPRLVSKGRQIQ